MRSAFAAFFCLAFTVNAYAQATGVRVRNGDVYVQFAGGASRLTYDGQAIEATLSNDGRLIAYVQQAPMPGDIGNRNDLHVCSEPQKACVLVMAGRAAGTPDASFATIQNVRFSLQAAQRSDGSMAGSLFFLTYAAGANRFAVHRLRFNGKNLAQLLHATPVFTTFASSLEVVQRGRFAGALQIEQQTYADHGACGQTMIFDPNTRKTLQTAGRLEC